MNFGLESKYRHLSMQRSIEGRETEFGIWNSEFGIGVCKCGECWQSSCQCLGAGGRRRKNSCVIGGDIATKTDGPKFMSWLTSFRRIWDELEVSLHEDDVMSIRLDAIISMMSGDNLVTSGLEAISTIRAKVGTRKSR